MIFVSSRRDLLSKTLFSYRDLILNSTQFEWHCFFISCLPSILVDNLNAPFPFLIGILKDIFDLNVNEYLKIYLDAKDTPFAQPSAVIVDIDNGQVMQIEKYSALRHLEKVMPRDDEGNQLSQSNMDKQSNDFEQRNAIVEAK